MVVCDNKYIIFGENNDAAKAIGLEKQPFLITHEDKKLYMWTGGIYRSRQKNRSQNVLLMNVNGVFFHGETIDETLTLKFKYPSARKTSIALADSASEESGFHLSLVLKKMELEGWNAKELFEHMQRNCGTVYFTQCVEVEKLKKQLLHAKDEEINYHLN